MSWLRAWCRTTFRGRQLDADLDAELASALDELAARLRRRGLAPAEARRQARLAFGGVAQTKERTRDERVGIAFERVRADLGYAVRTLKAAPAFSLAVVATCALVVGANTAIFSIVKELLLEPLPYRDPARLVFIWSDLTAAGYPRAPLAGPELADLRERATRLEALGAIWANTAQLTGGDDPEQLRIGWVTRNFFQVLGVDPAIGGHFRPEDEEPGAPPAILLSWDLWQRRFAADPAIVGCRIEVNGLSTLVTGVMPRGFRLWLPADASVPDDLQAWRPFGRDIALGPRGQQYLRVVGRLAAGASPADANAEVSAIGRALGREFAEYGATPPVFSAVPLHGDTVRDVRQPLAAVFGGAALLLLLAGVNIANLFVARASARRQQFALRAALGAGRGRLLQQCLAEGLVLGMAGGAAGLAVAAFAVEGLLALRPDGLARVSGAFDTTVLGFSAGLALAWSLVVSLAAFWTVAGREAAGEGLLRDAASRIAGGVAESRLRGALVVCQIALGLVLVVAAGLLATTFVRLQHASLGFSTDSALTFRIAPSPGTYRTAAEINALQGALQDALAAHPAIDAVGAVSHLPFDSLPNWSTPYAPLDADPTAPPRDADARTLTPGYFAAIGAALVEGRDFTSADDEGARRVAIVDHRLAERAWPGQPAIGKLLRADPGASGTADAVVAVVGVVRHLRHRRPDEEVREQIYFPQRQVRRSPLAFVVKTRHRPEAAAAVKAAVARLDPRLPVYDMRPLDDYFARATSVRRFTAILGAAFSATALVLAAVGVYGVLAYAVARRRREIAIRLAVGARASAILALVVREAAVLGAVGLALGVAGAMAAARLLQSQLYEVGPYDAWTYAAAGGLLALSIALAAAGPAVRAARVPALDALRS
jgi:putative ABC transport system permease protein